LPLKGKILNVEKARIDKILSNEEIRTIITAIGAGIDEEFNIEKLRYHKIILMCDADVDGSHIRTLILTFFYRKMKKLLENGHIYIAQPPLFKMKRGKEEQYVQTEERMNSMLLDFGLQGVSLKKNGAKGKIEGKELRELMELVQAMEDLERSLARKGILWHRFLAAQDKKKGFPQYLVRLLARNEETFLYSEKEVEDHVQELEKKRALEMKAEEKEELAEAKAKDETKKEEKKAASKGKKEEEEEEPVVLPPLHEMIEIFEAKEFEKAKKRLEKYNLDFEDFESGEEVRFELSLEKETRETKALRDVLAYIKGNGKEGMTLQRYKGLGEMNPEQLWDTTMNPETRTVLKVTLDDAVEADEIFSVLMGDAVEPRRAFIERHAKAVRNLDV
ncbi:MAG TPA: toprim domain-containing protein, partial [Phycisphaerae bacterium]|nr:toprim domain-containing protein [Phycisphaerae bacterium]